MSRAEYEELAAGYRDTVLSAFRRGGRRDRDEPPARRPNRRPAQRGRSRRAHECVGADAIPQRRGRLSGGGYRPDRCTRSAACDTGAGNPEDAGQRRVGKGNRGLLICEPRCDAIKDKSRFDQQPDIGPRLVRTGNIVYDSWHRTSCDRIFDDCFAPCCAGHWPLVERHTLSATTTDETFEALYTREWDWRKAIDGETPGAGGGRIRLARADLASQIEREKMWTQVLAELKAIRSRDALHRRRRGLCGLQTAGRDAAMPTRPSASSKSRSMATIPSGGTCPPWGGAT